jgi:hypothetical protein
MRGEETGAWRGRISDDEPLEPQFAGQGRVDRDKSGEGSRRSSRASGSRTTSTRGQRANGAQGNGRRTSSSGANAAQRNDRRASSSRAGSSGSSGQTRRTG